MSCHVERGHGPENDDGKVLESSKEMIDEGAA